MNSADYSKRFHELVLNWKLRLVVSALLSILGLAILISTASGFFVEDFEVLDQTIVGVAVFVVVIPIYLIMADLPKIDEHTVAHLLNESIPDFENDLTLLLKSDDELNEEERVKKEKIKSLVEDKKLYRFLPNRPITQGVLLLLVSLSLTAALFYYFQ